LRDVPPGQRNDVDLLLGRLCAQLPNRAALTAAAQESGVEAEWTPAPDNAEMIRIVQNAMRNDPPIEY
jgi:fructose-specific component phosphotransferase system IIB-like protein